jgi:hypothetical protein
LYVHFAAEVVVIMTKTIIVISNTGAGILIVDELDNRYWILDTDRDFSLPHYVQTDCKPHPAFC